MSEGRAERPRQLLILIVAFNAASFIEKVLQRLPDVLWQTEGLETTILVLDDESQDRTAELAAEAAALYPHRRTIVLRNIRNQGYGGNQKLGYQFAIEEGFDAVVLVHGDGQYPPEIIPSLLAPIWNGRADVVLGSRMIRRRDALRGGMPLYKWLGNIVLTTAQNSILRTRFSEFHTGFRAYSVDLLRRIPFALNSNGFDFDTEIILQAHLAGARFEETPIPTYYGDEISHVNGLRYARQVLTATVQSQLGPRGIVPTRRFEIAGDSTPYRLKLGYESSHEFALRKVEPGSKVLDIGSGPGYMARLLGSRAVDVTAMDRLVTDELRASARTVIEGDIDTFTWDLRSLDFDTVLMLDVIEHSTDPERLMQRLRAATIEERGTSFVLTTPNIAFAATRISLLLGFFNYGERGILDRDHKRLFTVRSFERFLQESGFAVVSSSGIPAPIPEALGSSALTRALMHVSTVLARRRPTLFAYQLAFVAKPLPTLEQIMAASQTFVVR
jgi:glycosyltransferase involved in cell wall biosynthesis/SAM-dependent methyltransferase